MAKKNASKRAKAKGKPSKPTKPKRKPGEGVKEPEPVTTAVMDSVGEKNLAMSPLLESGELELLRSVFSIFSPPAKQPTKSKQEELITQALAEREALIQQKEVALMERERQLLEREQRFKSEVRFPPFPNDIEWLIRSAPKVSSLEALAARAIQGLRMLAVGNAHHSFRFNESAQTVRDDSLSALARLARKFRKGLTTKTTPAWLLALKTLPAFGKAFEDLEGTKGAHDKDPWPRTVFESKPDSSGSWHRCEFEGFQYKLWRVWLEGEELQDEGGMTPTTGVLSQWVFWTIYEFDKWHERWPENYSRGWPERWTDEGKYLDAFMVEAEQKWNEEGVAEIQIRARGLLRTNSGGSRSKPRQEFKDFATDVRRLAERQLRDWKKTIH